MTELQYFWGWAVYLTGAFGCLLSLWFIVRQWHPRAKRPLMMVFAVLFFLPGTILPEQSFLGPAFFISLYDGLSLGGEATWRTAQMVVITAGVAAIAGLLLPVARAKTETHDNRQKRQAKKRSLNHQGQRKEPTC